MNVNVFSANSTPMANVCVLLSKTLTQVAQAGLLAQQDSKTPSLSVAIMVLISILGNLVFVLGLGYGLIGAGVTTVATQ